MSIAIPFKSSFVCSAVYSSSLLLVLEKQRIVTTTAFPTERITALANFCLFAASASEIDLRVSAAGNAFEVVAVSAIRDF